MAFDRAIAREPGEDGRGAQPPGTAHVSTSWSADSNASSSVCRADRDAQAAVEARPRRAVADEDRAVEQRLPHLVAVDGVAAGRARSSRRTATRRAAGRAARRLSRPRSSTSAATRCVHLVAVVERESPGDLLERVEVVRQHDLVELAHEPRRADEIAEAGRGHRPRLRVGPGDDERTVVVDELERGPRRELAVRLVDDEQTGRELERAPHRVLGLDQAGRVVRRAQERDVGRARREDAIDLVDVEGEVVASLARSRPRCR